MTLLFVVAALACLAGELLGMRDVVYVAKPVTTLALFAIASRTVDPVSPDYRTLISIGLLASLAGDVFLMLPDDRFLLGLGCFFVAHMLYIAAFATTGGGLREPAVAVVIAAIAAAVLAYMWPGLGDLRIAVLVYSIAIATMAWQAIARWRNVTGESAALAATGAMSFLVSDSALGVQRFRVEFPLAPVVVLGTYWLAQWCIARSVAKVPARG